MQTSSPVAPLLTTLLLTACVAAPPRPDLGTNAPVFDPAIFFAGNTHGDGQLRIALSGTKTVRVDGHGRSEPDGTLVLDQKVDDGGPKPKQREWRLRQTAPGHWTGTLTDANGPVSAITQGNTLHIAYPMKGGLKVEQWLYLQPDGKTALNRMSVSEKGMGVAGLEETIRRTP